MGRSKAEPKGKKLEPVDDLEKKLDEAEKRGKSNPKATDAPPKAGLEMELPRSNAEKMAEIFTKYFGSEPEKKIEIIDVGKVHPGTWRQLRKDGVLKIRKSIQTRGVLPLSFWCVMKTEEGDYLAIDCNHRLYAFKAEGITTAKALVFPTLSPAEYKAIAGVCNEIHDQGTVHVTDWDKFYVLRQMLQSGEYTKGKNVYFSKLEKDMVRYCAIRRKLIFLGFSLGKEESSQKNGYCL
jgi:hypothetical protein